jgi:hypothetical protein
MIQGSSFTAYAGDHYICSTEARLQYGNTDVDVIDVQSPRSVLIT